MPLMYIYKKEAAKSTVGDMSGGHHESISYPDLLAVSLVNIGKEVVENIFFCVFVLKK